MRIHILAVGRIKAGPEFDLAKDYRQRFDKTGKSLGLRGLHIVEVESGGGTNAEGDRLLAKRPAGAKMIRLDEQGDMLTSERFARKLATWRDQGTGELAFLIGGAAGFSEAVKREVPMALALGPQTWPHKLVRALWTEQLYRAASILAGTPYHKA